MQVVDDSSTSRKGRKANIRVINRGAQQQAPVIVNKFKADSQTVSSGLAQGHVSINITNSLLPDSLCLV